MSWQCLWHAFARHIHGDVVEAFIARKTSRKGKKFGFVRLSVSMAKYGEGVPRRCKYATERKARATPTTFRGIDPRTEGGGGVCGSNETTWDACTEENHGACRRRGSMRMRRCLVGEMSSVTSVSNIKGRVLHEWGLGEIKVQRMGGKLYLLSIEDDELFLMPEELDWSYLKEIFCRVELWTEKMIGAARATWLEVSGIPLHCWNHVTPKRIADL
ncbi:hypothetical protein V6N13_000751 [Hibiscus sabdariffa]